MFKRQVFRLVQGSARGRRHRDICSRHRVSSSWLRTSLTTQPPSRCTLSQKVQENQLTASAVRPTAMLTMTLRAVSAWLSLTLKRPLDLVLAKRVLNRKFDCSIKILHHQGAIILQVLLIRIKYIAKVIALVLQTKHTQRFTMKLYLKRRVGLIQVYIILRVLLIMSKVGEKRFSSEAVHTQALNNEMINSQDLEPIMIMTMKVSTSLVTILTPSIKIHLLLISWRAKGKHLLKKHKYSRSSQKFQDQVLTKMCWGYPKRETPWMTSNLLHLNTKTQGPLPLVNTQNVLMWVITKTHPPILSATLSKSI